MSKFVVLDPSLSGVGFHNFEYDLKLLRAAERCNFQPELGSHQDFGDSPELAPSWQIYRTFRVDQQDAILEKLHHCRNRLSSAESAQGTFALAHRCRHRIDRWRYGRRYARWTHGYGTAMDAIWSGSRLARGDQVFLASAMPSDIAGLADWAGRNRAAREVDWHLQFHFPLVNAAAWYAQGSREYAPHLHGIPAVFQELLEALGRNRVHLYATTAALSAHLEHCLGEPFETLHFPINPAIGRLRAGLAGNRMLRVTSAGQPRSEKGAEHWSQIVSTLTADYFATGRLQIALQAKSPEDLPAPLRQLATELASPIDRRPSRTPLALAGWPLSPRDYVEFLAGSDIGLLMYDPAAYDVRISGVMAELLGAGVPVVVPAACALADQISEPIFAYQEQLRERLSVVANRTTAELDWQVAVQDSAAPGIIVGIDGPGATVPAAVAETAVPAHATHLLVLFERDAPNPWNRYLSVSTDQRDAEGRSSQRRRDVIGFRDFGRPMTVLVPLESQCRRIEIRLQTALGHEPLVVRRMDCCFLAASAPTLALGGVGRLASDAGQAADCLRDIVDHYEHYEKTARAFATDWAAVHTAEQVLRDLKARAARASARLRKAA